MISQTQTSSWADLAPLTTTIIRIDAAQYEDDDNCLTAAAHDVAEARGLQGLGSLAALGG